MTSLRLVFFFSVSNSLHEKIFFGLFAIPCQLGSCKLLKSFLYVISYGDQSGNFAKWLATPQKSCIFEMIIW